MPESTLGRFQSRTRKARWRATAVLASTAFAVGSLVSVPSASASTALPADGSSTLLASLADLVVQGHVTGAGTSVAGTDMSPVDTLVPVAIDVAFKGAGPSTVSVRIHGGDAGNGYAVDISNEPVLSLGEHAVFYLAEQADGTYRPVDNALGVIPQSFTVQGTVVSNPLYDTDPLVTTVASSCAASDGPGYSGYNATYLWGSSGYTFKLGANALTNQSTIDAMANTWNNAGEAFHITDGGLDPTITGPDGNTADGKNGITFVNLGADGGALAVTAQWHPVGSPYLVDTDITFNTYYSLSTNPSSTQYDLQSVGTHEFGHTIGLGHVQDTAQVMYPCLQPAQIKRNLGFGDIAGARNIYPPDSQGYYLVDQSGAVFGLGGASDNRQANAPYYGGANVNNAINYPTNVAEAIAVHVPTRAGYWILASNGTVYAYGDAQHHGAPFPNLCSTCHAVTIKSTASGNGYWILSSDGGIFNYGDAGFHGSGVGVLPSGTYATGLAVAPDGSGYWILNNVGEIFAFNVLYHGGCFPNCATPTRSAEVDHSGGGYWIVDNGGNISTFGDAPNLGSAPGWGSPESLTRHPLFDGYAWTAPNGDVTPHSLTYYGRGTTSIAYAAMAETDYPVPPSFSLSGPGKMTVTRGKCSSATVNTYANNTFYATVSLSTSGAPSGSSSSISPSSFFLAENGSASSTLTVCAGATQLNNFTVNVYGSGSNGTSASTSVAVTVQLI